MSLVEFCGHATYLLLAVSYVVRDIVWLRIVSIPASVCSILFNYFAPAEPLWLIINWNLIFLLVNVSQLALSRWEGREDRLSAKQLEFARFVSPRLTVAQSVKLLKQAQQRTITGPSVLIEEGTCASQLVLVVDGSVEVSKDGDQIGSCSCGAFLGEISFLTGEPHTASVTVPPGETTVVLSWDQKRLTDLIKSRPQFHLALQRCLAANLSRKFTVREKRDPSFTHA